MATKRKVAVSAIAEDPELEKQMADAAEQEREAAFDHPGFTWRGKALKPFSSGRESKFYRQRLAVGAPDLWAAIADVYGFFADAVLILYLCSHDPEEYGAVSAQPVEWQLEIDRWAEKNVDGSEKVAAINLAREILFANSATRHEAAAEPGGKRRTGKK